MRTCQTVSVRLDIHLCTCWRAFDAAALIGRSLVLDGQLSGCLVISPSLLAHSSVVDVLSTELILSSASSG